MNEIEKSEAFSFFKTCSKCEAGESERLFGNGSGENGIMLVFPEVILSDGKPSFMSIGEEILLSDFLSLFDRVLAQSYQTSLTKCFLAGKTENAEKNCIDFLRFQYKSLKPNLILCFGEKTGKTLIAPSFDLKKEHGKIFQKGKTAFSGTFSLSAALGNPEVKRTMLSDFTNIFASNGVHFE